MKLPNTTVNVPRNMISAPIYRGIMSDTNSAKLSRLLPSPNTDSLSSLEPVVFYGDFLA